MADGGDSFSPGRAITRTLAAAAMLALLFAVVSLNGDAEQERFNGGAINTIATAASLYMVGAGWMLVRLRGRELPAGHRQFMGIGGVAMIAAALAAYCLAASLLAGRVL